MHIFEYSSVYIEVSSGHLKIQKRKQRTYYERTLISRERKRERQR